MFDWKFHEEDLNTNIWNFCWNLTRVHRIKIPFKIQFFIGLSSMFMLTFVREIGGGNRESCEKLEICGCLWMCNEWDEVVFKAWTKLIGGHSVSHVPHYSLFYQAFENCSNKTKKKCDIFVIWFPWISDGFIYQGVEGGGYWKIKNNRLAMKLCHYIYHQLILYSGSQFKMIKSFCMTDA